MSFPRGQGGALALNVFRVRGGAIGKGMDFPDIGIKNGVNFHNFGMRNSTDFQDFGMKYNFGYTFSKSWYKVGYTFSKNWYKEGVCFRSLNGTSPTKIWSSAPPGSFHFMLSYIHQPKRF